MAQNEHCKSQSIIQESKKLQLPLKKAPVNENEYVHDTPSIHKSMHDNTITNVANKIIMFLKTLKRTNFMIIGPDPHAIEECMATVFHKISYDVVYVTTQKDSSPNKKFFVIDISLKTNLQYQSFLYYYLELSTKFDCYVCLTSTSIQCLNTFEKRVKSRFKNKIYVLGYKYNNEDNFYSTHKSLIQDKAIYDFHKKYNLEFYSVNFVCSILEPLHFMLLLISTRHKVTNNNVLEVFKKNAVKELKNAHQSNIIRAYYDLLEFRWIGTNGDLLVDKTELNEYIQQYCPCYLSNY